MWRLALFPFGVFAFYLFDGSSEGLSCFKCSVSVIEMYNITCQELTLEGCQPYRRICSCCHQCAGKLNSVCNFSSPKCETSLVCVDENNRYLNYVPYFRFDFVGKCKIKASHFRQASLFNW